MVANELRGVANLDPMGNVGRIYIGDHLTSLHTKDLWVLWFQKRRLKFFPL